jgi:hypothetical protein
MYEYVRHNAHIKCSNNSPSDKARGVSLEMLHSGCENNPARSELNPRYFLSLQHICIFIVKPFEPGAAISTALHVVCLTAPSAAIDARCVVYRPPKHRSVAVSRVGLPIQKRNIAYAVSASDIPYGPDTGLGLSLEHHSDCST